MRAPKDELERLKEALASAKPATDPDRRAQTLARAMAEFDRLAAQPQGRAEDFSNPSQALPPEARFSKDRPVGAGFWGRLRDMYGKLTSKMVLGAGASLATVAVAMVMVTQSPPQLADMGDAVPASSKMGASPAAIEAAPSLAQPAPSILMEHAQGVTAASRMSRQSVPLAVGPSAGEDRFADYTPSGLQSVQAAPVSTFSVDVDTSAWSWLRGSLRQGVLPPPQALRLEEIVNYFPYSYAPPDAHGAPFSTTISSFQTPWNKDTQLVRIGLQGRAIDTANRPPLNLVFLVDTSGSMEGADRLELLKAALPMLLEALSAQDQVAIVAYAGAAGEVLPPTPADQRDTILAAFNALEAGGSTAGGEGLQLAYRLARQMQGGKGADQAISRVVLATDGDFNVGPASEEALKALVSQQREGGSFLSVLGFGRGNFNDALMQVLAQNGNGFAAYIDSAEEARKVLLDQAQGALFTIAQDVKVQVEWNPAVVSEYRLLGFETRALSQEDFANDKVDAGDIGAGHQMTALYEVTPVGSPAQRLGPSRYVRPELSPEGASAQEMGWLRLRYKQGGSAESQLIEAAIPLAEQGQAADQDANFAAAIAGFGQLLQGGKYLGDWGYEDAIALARAARGEDEFGYRAEAIRLMETAQALSKTGSKPQIRD